MVSLNCIVQVNLRYAWNESQCGRGVFFCVLEKGFRHANRVLVFLSCFGLHVSRVKQCRSGAMMFGNVEHDTMCGCCKGVDGNNVSLGKPQTNRRVDLSSSGIEFGNVNLSEIFFCHFCGMTRVPFCI